MPLTYGADHSPVTVLTDSRVPLSSPSGLLECGSQSPCLREDD